jgi:hypothetical protein
VLVLVQAEQAVLLVFLGLNRGISLTMVDSRHLAGGVLNNNTVIKL